MNDNAAQTHAAQSTLDYASDLSREQTTDRALRRVVGWGAVIVGGTSIVSTSLSLAMITNMLLKPANVSYAPIGTIDLVFWVIDSLSRIALLVGGVLLLTKWTPACLRAIRDASIAVVCVGLASPLNLYFFHPSVRSQFASLGSIAQLTTNTVHAAIPALLLIALTLPPLGPRMMRGR